MTLPFVVTWMKSGPKKLSRFADEPDVTEPLRTHRRLGSRGWPRMGARSGAEA